MYNLDKLRNEKSRGRILRLYSEDTSAFFRLNSVDKKKILNRVESFSNKILEENNCEGYLVPLDYGLNSIVTAKMLVETIGNNNVYGILLNNDDEYVKAVKGFASDNDIELFTSSKFSDVLSSVNSSLSELNVDTEDMENYNLTKEKIRTIVISDISKKKNYLVTGCNSASERLLGVNKRVFYNNLADVELLHNLFKTTVKELSLSLGLSDNVIDKSGSYDDTLKIFDVETWKSLDTVLLGYELNLVNQLISEVSTLSIDKVERIKNRIRKEENEVLPKYPSFTF